jgi:hypothetical protein
LRRSRSADNLPRLVKLEDSLAVEEWCDVSQTSERKQSFRLIEPHHLGEVALRGFAGLERSRRAAVGDALFAGSALRLHRDQCEDAIELESGECLFCRGQWFRAKKKTRVSAGLFTEQDQYPALRSSASLRSTFLRAAIALRFRFVLGFS